MFTFAIVLVIAFICCLALGGSVQKKGIKDLQAASSDYSKSEAKKVMKAGKAVKLAGWFLLFILFVSIVVSGIRIVDSTEIGVIKTFGKINGTIDEGLNLVNPFTDQVTMYDLRVHVKEASFASYTKDAQPLTAAVEYQYNLDPAFVEEIAQKYGSYDILETKLGNIVEERVKIVFSRYSAMDLLENRSHLSAEVDEEVTNVEEMFHVTFTSVIIRDIDFSDAFEASVEQKMEAEQKALKAEQEKKEAVIRAEQEEEVAKIQARAAVAAAQGEADALMITKEALEKMPANYTELEWIAKWNGVLPQLVSEDSSLMLAPNINE